MTHPEGTLTRNTTGRSDQPLDHRRLLCAADAFWPLDVSPDAVLLSALFGGGEWSRAVHPWIGIALLLSYAGLIV
jgi:formate dehydrogenase subunit gamma